MMNIHLHKKKTLVFVCIVLVKILGALFIYFNVSKSNAGTSSYSRKDRYEYLQQKKLQTLKELLKTRSNVNENIYDLSKVSLKDKELKHLIF
jgi:hypothetical protein